MKHLKVFWLWIKETHKDFGLIGLATPKPMKSYSSNGERQSVKKDCCEAKDVVDAVKGK